MSFRAIGCCRPLVSLCRNRYYVRDGLLPELLVPWLRRKNIVVCCIQRVFTRNKAGDVVRSCGTEDGGLCISGTRRRGAAGKRPHGLKQRGVDGDMPGMDLGPIPQTSEIAERGDKAPVLMLEEE
jgi:hypothetical protein